MFNKKTRRNFRQRKGESSDEDEQKNGDGDESNKVQAATVNIKQSKLPQSRGISCSSKREVTPPKSDSDVEDPMEDSGPTGTNVSSRDERKNKGTVLSFTEEKEVEGSEFKLKKASDKAVVFQARKKDGSPAKTTYSYRPPARRDVTAAVSPRGRSGSDDEDDDDIGDEELSPDTDPEEDARSTTSSSASYKDSNSSSRKKVVIPDARRIEAARRQRQHARAQKEFIPLGREGGDRSPGSSTHSTSGDQDREEREDRSDEEDDDDEPDDHERRIEFAPRSKTIRERIAEKLGGSGSEGSDSDDSQEKEDQEMWEEQQIGKGVKRPPGEQSPGSDGSASSTSRSRRKTKPVIPERLPHVSITMVTKRISGKLDSLRSVHRAREAELRKMEVDMDDARTALENLENGSSDRQLEFYRNMNLYVQNLVECLSEKAVEINLLELEMHTLLSDQAEALLARRREAVRLESLYLQQQSHTSDPQGEGESAADLLKETQGEEECDSLPADTEPSSEEEAELQKKRAELVTRAQGVFADVQEDFWEVKKVLSRFQEWRGSFSDSYHSAYISLCLPKLLNPLIRQQLVGWSPLQPADDFEALPWYSAVEVFCHGQGFEEAENPDRRTLPAVIDKTLLPKMQGWVELVWDPLSSRQSSSLAGLCHRLQSDYSLFQGEQSKQAKAFVEAVIGRLRSSVDEDVFIPFYPKKLLEDRSSPQRCFRDRQFWTAVKLLGSVVLWEGVVPEEPLKELALDTLLNRHLMLTLLNEPRPRHSLHKSKKVALCFPKSWFREVTGGSSLPQLRSLSDHLLQMAHSLCKQPDSPDTRSFVAEVLTVLASIRAWDNVTTIADKYGYEDLVKSLNLS